MPKHNFGFPEILLKCIDSFMGQRIQMEQYDAICVLSFRNWAIVNSSNLKCKKLNSFPLTSIYHALSDQVLLANDWRNNGCVVLFLSGKVPTIYFLHKCHAKLPYAWNKDNHAPKNSKRIDLYTLVDLSSHLPNSLILQKISVLYIWAHLGSNKCTIAHLGLISYIFFRLTT